MERRDFYRNERGFTGAERALLICCALAVILLCGILVRGGSEQASEQAARVLASGAGEVVRLGDVGPLPQAGDVSPGGGTQEAQGSGQGGGGRGGGGLVDQVTGFFGGIWDEGKDTVTGLGHMAVGVWNLTAGWLTDPAQARATWDGLTSTLTTIVEHPGEVWDAFTAPYVQDWRDGNYGHAIGRGVFDIAMLVVGTKGLTKLARLVKGGEAVEAVGYTLDANKYKYFFGEIERPDEALRLTDPKKYGDLMHNFNRSQQLKQVLSSLGMQNDAEGQAKLAEIFREGLDGPELSRSSSQYGTTITRGVVRDGVRLEIKYFYEGGDLSKTPKVVTIIPKVFR